MKRFFRWLVAKLGRVLTLQYNGEDGGGKTKSQWFGNPTEGIEFRYLDDDLDEVCLHVGGRCVFHLERMDDSQYWMGLYSAGHISHVTIVGVVAVGEGWLDDNTPAMKRKK